MRAPCGVGVQRATPAAAPISKRYAAHVIWARYAAPMWTRNATLRGTHLEGIRGTRHLGAINGTPEAPEAGQHPPRSGLRGSRKSRRKRYRSGQREAQETPDSLKEPWSVDLGAISGTPQISTLRFTTCPFPHTKFTKTAIS